AVVRGGQAIYGLYVLLVFLASIVPTWTLVKISRSRKFSSRVTRAGLRLCCALGFIPVRVSGSENIPRDEACVLVANHTSYADVPILMKALGTDYRFVAKIEVLKLPFIGTFTRKLGHLWFERANTRSRHDVADQVEALLRNGISVLIFPEGTFTASEGVRPFQLGAFKAALSTGAPIVPVSVRRMRSFLRDGWWLPRPARIEIAISQPMRAATKLRGQGTSASWEEMVRLRDAARAEIARQSGEAIL
ncbi:MAG TPA: lysophospholipid acyltransferase family protein, partial [Candidatus Acidoferrales bacterium]|nr:lysophospholipid acyltransferase family protein [Candidatus Acidoferrales bacterium]